MIPNGRQKLATLITPNNTFCQISDPRNTEQWTGAEAYYEDFIKNNSRITANITGDLAAAIFRTETARAICSFPKIFGNKIKTSDLTTELFFYLIRFIEEKYNLIKINNPDNQELLAAWKTFRCDIAYLRYKRDPSLAERVSRFMHYMSDESKKIDQYAEIISNDEVIWNEWNRILECPDVLDLELALLCSKVHDVVYFEKEITVVQLTVKTFQTIFTSFLNTLLENLPWVADEIKELLAPFETKKQHKMLNNSKLKLYVINNLIKKTLPELAFLNLNTLENTHISDQKVRKLITTITNLALPGESTFFGSCGRLINGMEFAIKSIEEGLDPNDEDALEDIDFYQNQFFEAVGSKVVTDFGFGYMTLNELKEYLPFLYAQQKCHILFDTYILKFASKLDFISTGIFKWYEEHKSTGKLHKSIAFVKKSNPNQTIDLAWNIAQKDSRDIDSLVKTIEGPEKHGTLKSKKSKITNSERINQIDKPSKEKLAPQKKQLIAPSKIPKLVSHANLSIVDKIAKLTCRLKGLIISQPIDFKYRRAALRQSLMNLDDLKVNYLRLQDKKIPAALHAVATISSAYYHMEQLIRFMRLKKNKPYDPTFLCDEHNLKGLLRGLILKTKYDDNAPKMLYLGNYWTYHTFQQLAGWGNSEDTPTPLKCVQTAFEKNSVSESILNEYSESTLAFSNSFLSIESSLTREQTAQTFFEHQQHFKQERVKAARVHCENFIKILENTSHPSIIKLKQAHQNLIILDSILTLINQKKIDADEFSQLLRGAIFWQNGVLESLLQAIFFLKTGINSQEHDLFALYEKINWSKQVNIAEPETLSEIWPLVNNLCRYPYDFTQIKSPIHELILQAELLKERPDLGSGFKEQNKKATMVTALNFIPVAAENLEASHLLVTLEKLLSSAWDLMQNRLIPEIRDETSL